MTAQPIERPGDSRVRWIARNIRTIAAALPADRRKEFLEDVMGAEQGAPVFEVMELGWREAMICQVPSHEQDLYEAEHGINLQPGPDLIEAEA
jgi:hypothetical protein